MKRQLKQHLALLLNTAQRRSDVVRMGRKHVRGDVVDVCQQKTGKFVPIPMHPELVRILAATPAAITPTFLMTAYGKAFTAAGFGGWFRDRCDEDHLACAQVVEIVVDLTAPRASVPISGQHSITPCSS